MLPSTTSPQKPQTRASHYSHDAAASAQETLTQVRSLATRAIEANLSPESSAKVLAAINAAVDRAALEHPSSSSAPAASPSSALALVPRATPTWQRRPILPAPARVWRVAVTSATVRHRRVEYELRAELSALSPAGHVLASGTSVVRRRFRDFVKLHEALSRFPGVTLPSLPPKSLASVVTGQRAEPSFVWARRVALQLWLRFVCDHHVLRHTTALREFLWEFDTSAVTGAHFVDMTPSLELGLTTNALKVQAEAALAMYGSNVVALTAMASRLSPLRHAYHNACKTAQEVARLDARVVRGKMRLASALCAWAEFEQGEAGQSFGFVVGFANNLPPRPAASGTTHDASFVFAGGGAGADDTVMDDSMVSFAPDDADKTSFEAPKSSTGAVETPIVPGAAFDARSLSAFAQLVELWGDGLLPALHKFQVDPRRVRADEASRRAAERGAGEWTELEGIRPAMIRDGAARFVEDQLRKTMEDARRWKELAHMLKSEADSLQGVLQSFESIGTELADLDASRLSPDKSVGSGLPGQQVSASAASAPQESSSRMAELDEDLDKAQSLFREREDNADSFPDDPRLRYLNPFLGTSSDDD